jgi:hypothetical protein
MALIKCDIAYSRIEYFCLLSILWGHIFGWGIALQTARFRVWFPMVSLEYFVGIIIPSLCHIGVGCNRIEYQEYFLAGKGGRCVWLTTLPPSKFWDPQRPGNLWAFNMPVQVSLCLLRYYYVFMTLGDAVGLSDGLFLFSCRCTNGMNAAESCTIFWRALRPAITIPFAVSVFNKQVRCKTVSTRPYEVCYYFHFMCLNKLVQKPPSLLCIHPFFFGTHFVLIMHFYFLTAGI